MKLKKHIPNFITSLNLFSGCLAILASFNHALVWAAVLIGIAAIFDFMDGLMARLLKVQSEIGKQLDSLADVISFGLAPGMIMFQLITIANGEYLIPIVERSTFGIATSLMAFLIPVLSAYRLAKFNIDTRQSESFIGLPTPANAIFIGALVLIVGVQLKLNIYSPESLGEVKNSSYNNYEFLIASVIFNPGGLVLISVIMSLLLVSDIPLFALKFKNLIWADNKIRFTFLLIAIALLIFFQLIAIPAIVLVYILLSIINNFVQNRTK